MQMMILWSRIRLIMLALGSLSLMGCPQSLPLADSHASPEIVLPIRQTESTDTAIADDPASPVNYDVCGELVNWERPSLAEQMAALMANPRYGSDLDTEPLRSLFEEFWHESLITFTTYGLSARTEPIYLSGVWTGIEAMAACYEGDRPAAINAGELAEMWLMGYQIVDFVWTGDRYQVTVEHTTGLRFVQFKRAEQGTSLPIVVLQTSGEEITVASGDWPE